MKWFLTPIAFFIAVNLSMVEARPPKILGMMPEDWGYTNLGFQRCLDHSFSIRNRWNGKGSFETNDTSNNGVGNTSHPVLIACRSPKIFPFALEPTQPPSSDSKPNSGIWGTRAVRAPRVEYRTFESAAARSRGSYHIYLPEVHDREKDRRFPVLYWLHGSGGGLAGIRPLSAFFDDAIQKGKIPPMLIVFPNGMANSMWCDSKDGRVPMETVVVKELLPEIDRSFRTVAGRDGRIIEGFSMGGYGAARLGFKYPDLFGTVSILAGGPLDRDFQGPRAKGNPGERERILKDIYGGDLEDYRAKSPLKIVETQAASLEGKLRIRVIVGERDFTRPLNRAFSDHLKKHKIDHEFKEVNGVGHDTIRLLQGMGEANWDFYKRSFSQEKR